MQIYKERFINTGLIALFLTGAVLLSSCGSPQTTPTESFAPSPDNASSFADVSDETGPVPSGGTSEEQPPESQTDTSRVGDPTPDSAPGQTNAASVPGTSGFPSSSDTPGTSGTTGTVPTEKPMTETQMLLRTYHDALDALMNAACAESTLSGRTTATLLGGVNFEQNTTAVRRFVRNGSVLDAESRYDSASSLKTIRQTVVKTASGYSVRDKDGAPVVYGNADYLAKYGVAPETFVPYVIEEDTLLAVPTRSVSGSVTRITFSLHPEKAAESYAQSVKAMVGSTAEFLGMKSITVTARIENGVLTGMTVDEQYAMKMLITITCTSKFEQTFQNIGSGVVKDW